MKISEETQIELNDALSGFALPTEYGIFARKWIAFNRAYNEISKKKYEWAKVEAIGDILQDYWKEGEIKRLAAQLVNLECIGGERFEDQRLLKPKVYVKAATLHLRSQFFEEADPSHCVFHECREEKQELCNQVTFTNQKNPDKYRHREVAALLCLVYQVRCNLVHGEKRIGQEDIQTNRDSDLIEFSTYILDRIIRLMLKKERGTSV